jgi:hypothetical protein
MFPESVFLIMHINRKALVPILLGATALAGWTAGCTASAESANRLTAVVTSVTVSPSTASSITTGTLPFTASVLGTTTDKSVIWSASSGNITSSGAYTAPSTTGTATITARSNADPTRSASATVRIIAAPAAPAPTPSPTPSPLPTTGAALPPSFFSQNWNQVGNSPTVPFGSLRLWDSKVSWREIETSQGNYDWSLLDQWLAKAGDHDVLYTFGKTPQWAGGGTNYSNPPSDVDSGDARWKAFIAALVEHAAGRIKYYEIWNEPNGSHFWSGTPAQLAAMGKDAYTIIHTLDPSAQVVGPSPSGGPFSSISFLTSYYAAGGATAQDIVSYHAYLHDNSPSPQGILAVVENLRALMTAHGIGDKPVWFTEGSWGSNTLNGAGAGILTNEQQSAYLAQQYIFLWSKDVDRYYWYSWDNNQGWGTLWDATNGIHPAGIAYGLLYSWLVGSSHTDSPCAQRTEGTWICTLRLANGNPAEIVWNPVASESFAADATFTSYQTLDNSAVNPIVNNTVRVGNKPILLK